MTFRCRSLVLLAVFASVGAAHRTPNFVVEAPTQRNAEVVGEHAERLRKEVAMRWLGKELPDWPRPCPIRVNLTENGAAGCTSFSFDNGRVMDQQMTLEGTIQRILEGVLPHEMTHVVLAHRFGRPVPRWADEGAAVLAEDRAERDRHDRLLQEILDRPRRYIPLRRLLAQTNYPSDVVVLYAEGQSLTRYLVERGGRPKFLAFVAAGMQGDWDKALHEHCSYENVEELEQAWQSWLRQEAVRRAREPLLTRIAVLEKELERLEIEKRLLQHEAGEKRLIPEQREAWEKERERLRQQLQRVRKESATPSKLEMARAAD
jgi:hypothetical protein